MKVEVNTVTHTVTLTEEVDLKELFEFLTRLDATADWKVVPQQHDVISIPWTPSVQEPCIPSAPWTPTVWYGPGTISTT